MEKKERELDVGTSRENPPWMTWPQSFGPTVTFRVIGSTRGPSFSIDSDWRTSSPREASRPGSDIEYNCRDSLENSSTLFSFLFIEREIDCQKLAGRSWLLCTQSVSRVTSKKNYFHRTRINFGHYVRSTNIFVPFFSSLSSDYEGQRKRWKEE